jgi:hypothetical protein
MHSRCKTKAGCDEKKVEDDAKRTANEKKTP